MNIKGYILFVFFVLPVLLNGQQLPTQPVSYRIFSPAIFNPAITGSQDFSKITFITNINNTYEAQTLNGDGRLPKSKKKLWPAPDALRFSNFGIGGYAFHEMTDSFRITGAAASLSYHIPVTRDGISFLSIGFTGKGIYSMKLPGSENADTSGNSKNENIFTPDIDFGIYFYSAHFFTGVSSTNFLSKPGSPGFPSQLGNTLSRQYFMTSGYKIIISKRRSILLEPSIILNFGTSSLDKSSLHYHPALKLYYRNSYIGSYLNDLDNVAFFMHLQSPWFYLSSYIEFPRNRDIIWYNGKLTLELSIGIFIGKKKTKSPNYKYW